jgi:hypothetical protein
MELTLSKVDIVTPLSLLAAVQMNWSNVKLIRATNRSDVASESIRRILTAVVGLATDGMSFPSVPVDEAREAA